MEKLRELETKAQCAAFENDTKSALELYSQCLLLCEQHNLPQEYYKRILGFKVLLQNPDEVDKGSLYDAVSYVMLEEQSYEGYWYASNAVKCLKRFDKALEFLIKGSTLTEEPSRFLAEIVQILVSHGSSNEEMFIEILKKFPKLDIGCVETQRSVIQKLVEIDCWEGVSLLITGIHQGPESKLDKSASSCSAVGVPVERLLKNITNTDKQRFGEQLTKALLENGATISETVESKEIPIMHAASEEFIETDQNGLVDEMITKSDVSGRHNVFEIDEECETVDVKNTETPEEYERLIEKADKAFNQKKFKEAVQVYIQAAGINCHPTDMEMRFHLPCSIAKCYLNLQNFAAVYEYAEACTKIDAQSPQGYLLLGQANSYMERFSEAFDAFRHAAILVGDNQQNMKREIIKHLCKCYTRCFNKEKERLPNESISTLPTGCKFSIIIRLVKQQQWTKASTFFEECTLDSINTTFTGENIDLNLVCNTKILSRNVWLGKFIQKMVENDLVDFRNLRLKSDEPYLHASVRIAFATGKEGLLELVTEKAKRCQEQNQLDRHGNTALHTVAKCPPGNRMSLEASRILLENEINPLLENSDQKTARDLTSRSDQELIKLLKRFEEKAKKGYHCRTRKKKRRWRKQSRSLTGYTNPETLDGDQHLDTKFGEDLMDASPEKCTCRRVIENMRQMKTDEGSTIESLVRVLQENHISSDHHKARQECLAFIADTVSKANTPDIPCVLTRVAEDIYVDFLHELMQLSQWELMCKGVKLYREMVGGDALSMFATDMSIVTMIQTVHTTNEDKIVEILEFMLDGGANLKMEEERLMKTVLQQSQYKILEALLRHDINPELLTVYHGDTPIHAAIFLGLQLDKGNFTIFKLFIEKYNENRRKYRCLDPRQVDELKNGLFHIVAMESDCFIVHEVTHTLQKLKLPLSLKNKEGLLPKDCLVCKHSDIQKIYENVKEEEDQMKKIILDLIYGVRMDNVSQIDCQTDNTHNDASIEKPVCGTLSNEGESFTNECEEETYTEVYFNPEDFENLVWEIQCTKDFIKTVRSKKVHPNLKERTVKCILELGKGKWRDNLHKRLRHDDPSGPVLYEIKLDKAVRIIWEKAIDISGRRQGKIQYYSEVIRLWNLVLDHDNIYKSVQNILRSYKRAKTSSNLSTCIEGKKHGDIQTPQTFVYEDSKTEDGGIDTHCLYKPVNPNDNEFNVMKFYTFSSDVVRTILENSEIELDFPFKVTDEEYLFINMKTDTPILLLGRSGTGKTTCCLYRLWKHFEIFWTEIERMQSAEASATKSIESGRDNTADQNAKDVWQRPLDEQCMADASTLSEIKAEKIESQNNMPEKTGNYFARHLRQIFVTKNPLLCMEVERNFRELRHACKAAEKHLLSENDPLPQKLQDVGDLQYPLFLTFRKLLELLDRSIADQSQPIRGDESKLASTIQGWHDCNSSDDVSKLRDSRSICIELSDDELSDDSNDESANMVRHKKEGQKQQRKTTKRKIMTYDIFVKEAWVKMRKVDTKCHPSLVWTEIVSFIKGSLDALNSPNGYLSLKEYDRLGKKMAPMFTGDREKIYEMFLIYEHVKKQRFFIDEADITRSIYNKLTQQGDPDILVHEVYVDETQDFTQAELCVLIQLCRNPSGIFMTGDTAQCIIHGISFRFEDLRTMIYSMSMKHPIRKTSINPKIHHLPHNYRSHAGILNLASSILELVREFFPESYDHLEKDSGMLDGPKPVIVLEKSLRDLPKILTSNQRHTSDIELGAHQVILVMNEKAKQTAETVFSKCLVITIDRAKGLEFDDVLLFNFFKDSHAKKEWRAVLDYQQKVTLTYTGTDTDADTGWTAGNSSADAKTTCVPRALEFDQKKHKVLNTELKLLYTAITRARTNVWIFDEDEESRAPMFYYFQERDLVDTTTHLNEFTQRPFSKLSTPQEWIAGGNYLYNHQRFNEAAVCYQNGEDSRLAEYSGARHSEQQADYYGDESMVRRELLSATVGYLKCSRIKRTASCLKKLGEFEILAKLYEHVNKMKKAANVYKDLKKPLEQSRCLEQLRYFGEALQVLAESGHFEEAFDCLERYMVHKDSKDVIPSRLKSTSSINYAAAKYYGRVRNKNYMLKYCEGITDEKKMEIFMSCDFIDEAANLLQRKGKQKEAIELYIRNGDVQKALQLLKETSHDDRKLRQSCIITGGQMAVVEPLGEDVDKYFKDLNEIIFDKSADTLLVAQATFIRGQLTESRNDIEKAFHMFLNERACYLGQLECIGWMMAKVNLADFKDVCKVLTYLGELKPIFHRAMLRNVSLNDLNGSDYMFYGIQYEEVTNMCKVYPRQAPLARKLCASKNQFEICLERESILDSITETTKRWLKKLQTSIDSQRMSMEKFLENPNETNVPKALTDITEIQNKKEESFLRLLQFHILTVWLNVVSKENPRAKCKAFFKVFFSLSCVRTIVEHNMQLENSLSKLLKDTHLKAFRNGIVEYLNTKFDRLQSTAGNSVRDFVEIILLRNTMDLTKVNVLEMMGKYESDRIAKSKAVDGWSSETESDKLLPTLRKRGKEHGIDVTCRSDSGKITFNSIAKRFYATMQGLNRNNAIGAANSFNNFCFLLRKNYKDRFEISIDVFLFWSETIFAVSLLHAVQKDAGAIIPCDFLSRMHYAETIFVKYSSQCLLQQIATYKSKATSSEFCLKDLMPILCGFSCKLNLLEIVRKQKRPDCKPQVDRALVLSLLILCNLGGRNSLDDSAIKTLASEVAYTLHLMKNEEALKQMKASRKTLDFVKPLQNILDSHSMHLQICTWGTHFDFQSVGSSHEIEKHLPNLLLNEETLECIQNPAEGNRSSTNSASCETKSNTTPTKPKYEEEYPSPEPAKNLKSQQTPMGNTKHGKRGRKSKPFPAIEKEEPQGYTLLYQRIPDVNTEMDTLKLSLELRHHIQVPPQAG